jgi:cell division protein FtsQ
VTPDASKTMRVDPAVVAERTRKRFVRRQWARRWLRWRLVLATLLVLGLAGAGIWLVFWSSLLAAEEVEVTGNSSLSTSEVLEAADVPLGGPLARIDVDRVAARLRVLAPVKSVDVSRAWPHTVRVALVERTPVAVVELGSTYRAIDTDGQLFTDYRERPKSLPLIEVSGGADLDAMTEGANVVASLPDDIRRDVEHVEVETIDEIRLALTRGRTVVWGSADQAADKARVLDGLLRARPDEKTYDVSAPGQPTISR